MANTPGTLGCKICRLLGIDPGVVERVQLDISATDVVVTVTIPDFSKAEEIVDEIVIYEGIEWRVKADD